MLAVICSIPFKVTATLKSERGEKLPEAAHRTALDATTGITMIGRMQQGPRPDQAPSLHDLYRRLSSEELCLAEENLDRYVELTLRMYERIVSDPEGYAQFKALTASATHPTMNSERSNEQ
jgi:hypothetical protein